MRRIDTHLQVRSGNCVRLLGTVRELCAEDFLPGGIRCSFRIQQAGMLVELIDKCGEIIRGITRKQVVSDNFLGGIIDDRVLALIGIIFFVCGNNVLHGSDQEVLSTERRIPQIIGNNLLQRDSFGILRSFGAIDPSPPFEDLNQGLVLAVVFLINIGRP